MKPTLKLDWCSHKAAKYACQNWHYSKCMPSGSLVKIGIWENDLYIGCVLYGRGATPNLCKPYGLKQNNVCELVRIALNRHLTEVSRIMAISFKFLKNSSPELELIISFADSSYGHHGGIYQATNWIYSGAVKLDSWVINGVKKHPRSVVAKYGTQKKEHILKIDPNAHKIWGVKHRYLMPLKNKEKYIKLAKKYPKRIEHESNASDFQSEKGGAVPTDALHSEPKEAKNA